MLTRVKLMLTSFNTFCSRWYFIQKVIFTFDSFWCLIDASWDQLSYTTSTLTSLCSERLAQVIAIVEMFHVILQQRYVKHTLDKCGISWYGERKGKVDTHHSHSLFPLLPSGKRYRSICHRNTRLPSSFFPQAVRPLKSSSALHFTKYLFAFVM